MKWSRRGVTMMELLYAISLSMIVLAGGYGAYASFSKADEVEARREQMNLVAQSAMAQMKSDVRAAASVSASGNTMVASGAGGRIRYLASASHLERKSHLGRRIYKGISASFLPQDGGVSLSVRARATVHRRVIKVDLNSFVMPRG